MKLLFCLLSLLFLSLFSSPLLSFRVSQPASLWLVLRKTRNLRPLFFLPLDPCLPLLSLFLKFYEWNERPDGLVVLSFRTKSLLHPEPEAIPSRHTIFSPVPSRDSERRRSRERKRMNFLSSQSRCSQFTASVFLFFLFSLPSSSLSDIAFSQIKSFVLFLFPPIEGWKRSKSK